MSNTVIIGAGPIGLAWALMLHSKGVRDIVIVDEHAGSYYRPDHIPSKAFERINRYLDFKKKHRITALSEPAQLNDFERQAYENVVRKGINVVNKNFKTFINNARQKGVVVVDADGQEAPLEAYAVFDATGSERVVMKELQQLSDGQYLNTTDLSKFSLTPNQLIANIIIDKTATNPDDFDRKSPFTPPSFSSTEDELSARLKLREFGWERFVFPAFSMVACQPLQNATRSCMRTAQHPEPSTPPETDVLCSMEAPPNLPEDKKEEWIKLLLSLYTQGRISSYRPIAAETPEQQAVAIRLVESKPSMMEHFSQFSGSQALPTTMPIGSAIISSLYSNGDGLTDGLKCLKFLLDKITVKRGKIDTIDQIGYFYKAIKLVQAHKKKLKDTLFTQRCQFEVDGLNALLQKLKQGLASNEMSRLQKEAMAHISNEISGYRAYLRACNLITENKALAKRANHSTRQFGFFDQPKILKVMCGEELESLFKKAHRFLPQQFLQERENLQQLALTFDINLTGATVSLV